MDFLIWLQMRYALMMWTQTTATAAIITKIATTIHRTPSTERRGGRDPIKGVETVRKRIIRKYYVKTQSLRVVLLILLFAHHTQAGHLTNLLLHAISVLIYKVRSSGSRTPECNESVRIDSSCIWYGHMLYDRCNIFIGAASEVSQSTPLAKVIHPS